MQPDPDSIRVLVLDAPEVLDAQGTYEVYSAIQAAIKRGTTQVLIRAQALRDLHESLPRVLEEASKRLQGYRGGVHLVGCTNTVWTTLMAGLPLIRPMALRFHDTEDQAIEYISGRLTFN